MTSLTFLGIGLGMIGVAYVGAMIALSLLNGPKNVK